MLDDLGTILNYWEKLAMSLVIPPGFAEISLQLVNSGDPEPWYLTYGLDISEAGGDLPGVGVQIEQASAQLAPILNTSTKIVGFNIQVGTDGTPFTFFFPFSEEIEGDSSAERLPSNCATLITKYTGRAGRAGKGRFFCPSVPESAADQNGFVTSGWQSSTNDAFRGMRTDLLDPPVGFSLPMVLLHSDGIPGGSDPDPISELTCQPLLATQRRRMRH